MHGSKANTKIDRVGGIALIVEPDTTGFDEYILEFVWVGDGFAVGV